MNTNDQQRLNESIQRLYEQELPTTVGAMGPAKNPWPQPPQPQPPLIGDFVPGGRLDKPLRPPRVGYKWVYEPYGDRGEGWYETLQN